MNLKLRIALCLCLFATAAFGQEPVRALIITGGHGFNRESFFAMFRSFGDVTFNEVKQPEGNVMIEQKQTGSYDVLVFYDMYDSITPAQQKAYRNLLKNGKPMIFLHHSLVSYQHWKDFKTIVGGKYNTADSTQQFSTYEHDVMIPVRIAAPDHPITRGLSDFTIHDETYGICEILPGVKPLLATDHPKSLRYLAWINPCEKTQVVYIQLGHGPEAFNDANYRTLLHQAIVWSAQNGLTKGAAKAHGKKK